MFTLSVVVCHTAGRVPLPGCTDIWCCACVCTHKLGRTAGIRCMQHTGCVVHWRQCATAAAIHWGLWGLVSKRMEPPTSQLSEAACCLLRALPQFCLQVSLWLARAGCVVVWSGCSDWSPHYQPCAAQGGGGGMPTMQAARSCVLRHSGCAVWHQVPAAGPPRLCWCAVAGGLCGSSLILCSEF
jgi:hypothetical protein